MGQCNGSEVTGEGDDEEGGGEVGDPAEGDDEVGKGMRDSRLEDSA